MAIVSFAKDNYYSLIATNLIPLKMIKDDLSLNECIDLISDQKLKLNIKEYLNE